MVTVTSPLDRRASHMFGITEQHLNDWEILTTAHALFIEPFVTSNSIKGHTVINTQISKPTVIWTSDAAKFTPYNLFGKDFVSLDECFIPQTNAKLTTTSTYQATIEMKNAIGEFFVSQLQLSAEMCLGRNYNVMKTMEDLYSYELLVILLKNFKNEKIKSAAAYLILTLYIDRDPQSRMQLPRLTRVFNEIIDETTKDLVTVDEERMGEFGLLQYIISQHLTDLKGKRFPLYTFNLMQILQKLIFFNFYGEIQKLNEIIHLLIMSLKRDASDIVTTEGSAKTNSIPSRSDSYALLSSTDEDIGDIDNVTESLLKGAESSGDKEPSKLSTYLLELIESLTVNIITLTVAVISSAVTIYQFVVVIDSTPFFIFNVAIFIFFALELVLHIMLHMLVRKSFLQFILNIYNVLDIFVVLLLTIQFFNIGAGNFVKLVRISRLFVLFKLLESRRVEQKIENLLLEGASRWEEPDRYVKTPDYTLKTLVKIVDILCGIQDNIEDRNLFFLLKAFNDWSKQESPNPEDIQGILEKVFVDTSDIYVSNETYDDIFIDLLMYNNPSLVQSSLQLLMTHHSTHRVLINNVSKLQLITTEEGAEQFKTLERIINKLKRHADTHDIWGKLLTAEHKMINEDMLKFIPMITNDCKKLREVLKFDESHEPVKVTQNILRNLGCFEVCMKIVKLISMINPNDIYLESNINTRNLALITNDLIYWFILDNPANQALLFTELRFFMKTIDEKINSHKVIIAIFRNNIELMEAVPKKHISEFVNMIVTNGKFHQYLALMSSVIAVGEKNVIENQYEVIKHMASPDNQKKVIQYFVPINHPDYQKKVRLMNPFMDTKDVSIDDLPTDLAYHLELIRLLSSSTLGTSGMTSIEAKVQSMYFFVDIINAMLDPATILLAKIRLGLFFYNSVIDVETLLPALKDAECIWKFIQSTVDVFSFAKDELRQIEKNGWDSPSSNRQKIEYVIVCAMVVNGYFSVYYDSSIFRPEVGQTVGVQRVTLQENQANDIMKALYTRISLIYEMVSPLLPEEMHVLLYNTLVTLNDCVKSKIVAEVENKHVSFFQSAAEYTSGTSGNELDVKFQLFSSTLTTNESIKEYVDAEVEDFIKKLESIPWETSSVKSDVCFEPLLEKLILHIRGSIQIVIHGDDTIKFIEPMATKTAIWILKVFRTMIEKRWGIGTP